MKLSDHHYRRERHIHLCMLTEDVLLIFYHTQAFSPLQGPHMLYVSSSSRSQQNGVYVQETAAACKNIEYNKFKDVSACLLSPLLSEEA
jgi:hypothetical protein